MADEEANWLDAEPGWAEARYQLGCMWRAARKRWWWTLLATVVLVSGLVWWRGRKLTTFPAKVVLRLVEEDLGDGAAPPVNSKLQAHLREVALSRPALIALMERHDIYARERNIDINLALDAVRGDIELEVLQNHFSRERYRDDPLRTARVVITYWGRDADKSLAVARDLARIITRQQTETRQQTSEMTAAQADAAVADRRSELLKVRVELAKIARAEEETSDAEELTALRVKSTSLQRRAAALESELTLVERQQSELRLRADFEQRAMGLRFEIIDNGRPPEVSLSKTQRLTITGAVVFVLALPILAIGLGAFDTRVYDQQSVRRLGLEVIAHVPSFRASSAKAGGPVDIAVPKPPKALQTTRRADKGGA